MTGLRTAVSRTSSHKSRARWVIITFPPGASAVPSIKWDNLIATYLHSAPLKVTNERSPGALNTIRCYKIMEYEL